MVLSTHLELSLPLSSFHCSCHCVMALKFISHHEKSRGSPEGFLGLYQLFVFQMWLIHNEVIDVSYSKRPDRPDRRREFSFLPVLTFYFPSRTDLGMKMPLH